MEDTITQPALPHVEPTPGAPTGGGDGAGSEPANPAVVNVKDLLNQVLGKEFPTDEAALKSVKDTFDYVGSAGQKVTKLEQDLAAATAAQNTNPAPDLAATVKNLEAQVRDATFYAANPQFNTPEAKSLISAFGGNPEEVIKNEVFTKAFDAIGKVAEVEKSKSILHSNPRLGAAQDNMTKAVEAQKTGNDFAAAKAATAAVIEAYGLK